MRKYTNEASSFSGEVNTLNNALGTCLTSVDAINKSISSISEGDVLKENVNITTTKIKSKIENLIILLSDTKGKIYNKAVQLDIIEEEKDELDEENWI